MPPLLGASVAGILNATAESDDAARARVFRVFGTLLLLFFVLDIGGAFAVLWIQCYDNDDGDRNGYGNGYQLQTVINIHNFQNINNFDHNTNAHYHHYQHLSQCLRSSILEGLFSLFPQAHRNKDDNGGLGDLFWLAVARCIGTTVLLWGGIRYGRRRNNHNHINNNTGRMPNTREEEEEEEDSNGQQQVEGLLTQPLLDPEEQGNVTTVTAQHASSEVAVDPSSSTTTIPQSRRFASCCVVEPQQIQTCVLVALFITSTFYQVYAGLRVATMDNHHHHHHHHDSTSTTSTILEGQQKQAAAAAASLITPLLCLTVLWINAQGYVFRTLLLEMTRESGVFLPFAVHRHPVYLETRRAISVHWCDLCHKRIGVDQPQPENGTAATAATAAAAGCYRCSLCDFDICVACVQRNDAATVGENVLRGDRGVRVETALTTASYFRRSIEVAKQELPLLLLSFVLLGASSVSRLMLPNFQGKIIDKVVPDSEGNYDKAGFQYYIQLYIIVMVVQGAVSTLYSAIFVLVSRRIKFNIRNTLLKKILSQDVAYFDGTETGQLISRLTVDLDLMMSPIQSSLSSLLSNCLILAGGLVMCFVKSYRLSMLAFVTIGPISYLWDQYAQWSRGLAREMISFWAQGNGIASQALSNIRTVKAFGCEEHVLSKYTETNKRALDCGVKDAWGNGITSALTGYLDLGTGVLILYFGGHLVYRGEMSVGELIVFQLYWNLMNGAYQALQGLITSFTRSAAGAEKVFSMWDSDPDIDPQKGNDISWPVEGHLKLQDVSYYYQMRPDHTVLNKINLEVPAGKTLALVGRSGGGKSTIINLLLRFYDPKEGKILLDGREYESLNVTQLRRQFGVVTQETELFPLTIEENIAYGLNKDDYTMEDVVNAAKQACAHEFIVEMKDGYQTRIGERGLRISGGQRQRLSIARVFLRRPKIILLDEATSALDEHSQEAVQKALSNLIVTSNATVVLVAHRLSTVVNADSICVIDKGCVLEQGSHEELVSKGGIYASMVEKQTKKQADVLDQEKDRFGATTASQKEKTSSADEIDALLADN